MLSKRCKTCGVEKLVSFFRASNDDYRDGYSTSCKSCEKQLYGDKLKAFRKTEAGREHLRAQRRQRAISPSKKACERKHAQSYRERYPEKVATRRALRDALEKGVIVRPTMCEECLTIPAPRRDGRNPIHAHHADYAQPLSVRWLCAVCHSLEHRTLKEQP